MVHKAEFVLRLRMSLLGGVDDGKGEEQPPERRRPWAYLADAHEHRREGIKKDGDQQGRQSQLEAHAGGQRASPGGGVSAENTRRLAGCRGIAVVTGIADNTFTLGRID